MEENNNTGTTEGLRPDVLNYDDIRKLVPKLEGHEKLVNGLLHWLQVDEVNNVHRRWRNTPGPEFVRHMIEDDFKIKLRIDGEEVLDHLPQGAFITVSNHPFGALDGITLIYMIAQRRPKFKVMVNMILSKIEAMRPNFISVNAWASDDPNMKRVSVNGLREALRQIKEGEPLGFFPAGAMSKINWRLRLQDREWQKSVLQIIYKARVPVIPIFFHGTNSWWFNILGVVCWQARSLRLPAEVFRKRGKTLHVSVGQPIMPDEQAQYDSPEALGAMLRERTYALRSNK